MANFGVSRDSGLHRFIDGLRVGPQARVSLAEGRQNAFSRISNPERYLSGVPEGADLNDPAFLALGVVEHVVGDLVDGPFQSGDDATIQRHVPHHNVHECVHEFLLLIEIIEALCSQMPVMHGIALLKARRIQEMSPVRVEEEVLQFWLLRKFERHIDTVTPQGVSA